MKDGLHIDEYGTQHWFINGQRHRLDGPAVIWQDGGKRWYQNDQLHRTDGPAIEWSGGEEWYYLMDNQYTFNDWLIKRKQFIIQENIETFLS